MVSRALLWGVRARRLPAIRAPGWRGLHRATQSQSSVAPLATPNPAVKSWGYFTDVEGNLEFFKAASGISRVVSFNEARCRGPPVAAAVLPLHTLSSTDCHTCCACLRSNALELKEGCGLVFGGDCFDKGPGDIRISRALVDLKKRHPDRVFLLLGKIAWISCARLCGVSVKLGGAANWYQGFPAHLLIKVCRRDWPRRPRWHRFSFRQS